MDCVLARALCNKKRCSQLLPYVPKEMIAPDVNAFVQWLNVYWATYPEHDVVNFDAFDSMVNLRGGNLTPEDKAALRSIVSQVKGVDEAAVNGIVSTLHELAYSGQAAKLLAQYQEGDEIDLKGEMQRLHRQFLEGVKVQDELLQWENRSLDDVFAANEEGKGLKLRFLPELNRSVRALRGGDTVAVAAPVDAGKTSLLACIAADFANQMHTDHELVGDRCILWLVNESLAVRTVPRIYQAATRLTPIQMRQLHREGKFLPLYTSKVGRMDRIRVKDAHSITMSQIQTLLEEMRPAVLIVDMVANIRGGTMETEHQNLEAKWQELRVLGCEYDCLVLGTMQFSAEGYDLLYPPLTALKQSKIGVQGALDLAIFMGKLNNDTEGRRGISTPKNKCPVSGVPSINQFEVIFDAQKCQFDSGQQTPNP